MRRMRIIMMIIACIVFLWTARAIAHFGGVIPSDDIISQNDKKTITLDVKFFHPMEGD